MRRIVWQPAVLALVAAGGMYACAGPENGGPLPAPTASDQQAAAGGSAAAAPLTIRLTDSPFSEARALLVTFSEVSVHRADPGEWRTIPFAAGTSRTCDLKKLEGATDLLGVGHLPPGKYTQIRLTVTGAELFFDNAATGGACAPSIARPAGASAPVEIPSGQVRLNNEFTLASAGSTILLDFDGDRSVRQTGGPSNGQGQGQGQGTTRTNGRYMMTPVIRVVSVQ